MWTRARRRQTEEAATAGVARQEGILKLPTDLVGRGADRWPHGSSDRCPFGAQAFHGRHGRLQNARQGAAPSGVRRGNDASLWVGEQNRGAVGGERTDGEA